MVLPCKIACCISVNFCISVEINVSAYCSEEESSLELTNLTADRVDSVIAGVLTKRGLGYSEPLEDLKAKFDVRKPYS